jgi:hypothetical protein
MASATLSTTKRTWTGLVLNSCLRGKGPSTNCVPWHGLCFILQALVLKGLVFTKILDKSHAKHSVRSLGSSHVRRSYFLLNHTRQFPSPPLSLIYKISTVIVFQSRPVPFPLHEHKIAKLYLPCIIDKCPLWFPQLLYSIGTRFHPVTSISSENNKCRLIYALSPCYSCYAFPQI